MAEDGQSGLNTVFTLINKKFDNTNYPPANAHLIRVVAEDIDEILGVELKLLKVKLPNGTFIVNRR